MTGAPVEAVIEAVRACATPPTLPAVARVLSMASLPEVARAVREAVAAGQLRFDGVDRLHVLDPAPAPEPVRAAPTDGLKALDLAGLICALLDRHGPATHGELREQLAEYGYDRYPPAITRQVLANLAGRGQVARCARNRWVAVAPMRHCG